MNENLPRNWGGGDSFERQAEYLPGVIQVNAGRAGHLFRLIAPTGR